MGCILQKQFSHRFPPSLARAATRQHGAGTATRIPVSSELIEFRIIRQFLRDLPAAIDNEAIRLWTANELVEGTRAEKDESRRTAHANIPERCGADDRGGYRAGKGGHISKGMIKMHDPHRLAEGLDHVVIAIGMERVAAIVAADGDGNPAAAHFLDRCDAAPTRCPTALAILKIKVDRRQGHHGDPRLGAKIDGAASLRFGLNR
ncbi:MAG TPA: hypothetical protein VNF99_02565 [Stellaceae bacterium]|nr:hypothetical protein [Stellaceae bacterium]